MEGEGDGGREGRRRKEKRSYMQELHSELLDLRAHFKHAMEEAFIACLLSLLDEQIDWITIRAMEVEKLSNKMVIASISQSTMKIGNSAWISSIMSSPNLNSFLSLMFSVCL